MKSEVERSCTIKDLKKVDIGKYRRPAELVSALANGTRLAILHLILEYNEVCTCDLESALGIPQPTITAHLHKMYEEGLLEKREEWKYTYYSISRKYVNLVRTVIGE